MTTNLPPCGIYRTTAKIGGIDPGRLVYYHNHGDPGPGLYFPERWLNNPRPVVVAGHDRAAPRSSRRGCGRCSRKRFYRVTREFTCCAKK